MSIVSSMSSFAIPAGYKLGDGAKARAGEIPGVKDIFGTPILNPKPPSPGAPVQEARATILERNGLNEEQYLRLRAERPAAVDAELASEFGRLASRLQSGSGSVDRLA